MNPRLLLALALAAAGSVIAAIVYLSGSFRAPSAPSTPVVLTAAATPSSAPTAALPDATPMDPASTLLQTRLERLWEMLHSGKLTAADLARFRELLLAADPQQAIAAIREFLGTGRDAPTGQGFTLQAGGGLAEAPTLRVWLLDLLGQIARKARSPLAAQVSREILSTKTSADEWALALRNLAWAEPQSRAYLASKFREMLSDPTWRTAPSDGFLEALDIAVFTRDASLIGDLAEARNSSKAVSRAADVALDRLADTAPLDAMTYLNTHPTLLSERPLMRADYFAKADLGQAAQRAQVEYYLSRPDVAHEEKIKLLQGLLTPASFVSETLLSTANPTDDGSARRESLNKVSKEWIASNRFPELQSSLLNVQQRLGR